MHFLDTGAPAKLPSSWNLLQDLELGEAQQSEKSFLLADRHTSSLDEEAPISISRAHSRTPPTKPKASLQVTHDTSPSSQQGPDQGKRLKGLGLAGIATVFQAIMSVCAKILGRSRLTIYALVGHISAKASHANDAQKVPACFYNHMSHWAHQSGSSWSTHPATVVDTATLMLLLFSSVPLHMCGSHAMFRVAGQSGVPVFEILLVRGIMVLSISYMKAVTATQHTFPYALGKRSVLCSWSYTCNCDFTVAKHLVDNYADSGHQL